MLTYDGEYLAACGVTAALMLDAYGDPEGLVGRRIWDVAPGIERSIFGRHLQAAMHDRRPAHLLFEAEQTYRGHRVAASITPYPECVHVSFRFARTRARRWHRRLAPMHWAVAAMPLFA